MDIATLSRGTTGEGVRYLELFLREYTALFPGRVTPSCPRCLNEYLTRYKKHYKAMSNPCNYRLLAQYENIPLQFGSPILVNNDNITDEYAEALLSQPNGQRYFAQTPQSAIDDANPPAGIPHPANEDAGGASLIEADEDLEQTGA